MPDPGQDCMHITIAHDPVKCHWRKTGESEWTCEHGQVTFKHPRGWCNQGCCR